MAPSHWPSSRLSVPTTPPSSKAVFETGSRAHARRMAAASSCSATLSPCSSVQRRDWFRPQEYALFPSSDWFRPQE
eukprot:1327063-Pyramimonas_sp.AAC.1